MADRNDIDKLLDDLLQPQAFKDYGPNGLQVEGRREVRRLVSGVTASRALIEAAAADGADALLVHHGLFWRGHDGRLTGWLAERVRLLMANGINLFAYHLPLDAHPELGNNAQLGRRLGLRADGRFGDQALGFVGGWEGDDRVTDVEVAGGNFAHAPPAGETAAAPSPACTTLDALAARVAQRLGRAPLAVAGDGRALRRIAWCSGGAQGYFEAAIAAGADAFLTGEISEPQAHLARETGVAFLACGHHATERGGAAAVGAWLAARCGLAHRFVDLDNPA